ncbi:hypothetical protein ACFB49_33910 [Sphingomonas sp. DBB INV C78]|uniref:hypothetical protein n=1 Tax=Sphingomonas sp. DBB INV C78 TaxID=3349434 RepID=UPI0036D30D7B
MAWFRKKIKESNLLLGRWTIDPSHLETQQNLGNVSMEFDADGNLIYIIKSSGKNEAILMTYRLDGASIITDQPSHPGPQRTAYSLSDDGVLTLAFGGETSRFVRVG